MGRAQEAVALCRLPQQLLPVDQECSPGTKTVCEAPLSGVGAGLVCHVLDVLCWPALSQPSGLPLDVLAGAGRVALLLSPQCLPWAAAPKILKIQGQGWFPTWASHPSSTGHLSPLPPPPPTFIFEWTDTDCG